MQAPAGELDLPAVRASMRKMNDAQLAKYGRAAAYMASPAASYGPVRTTYVVQLAEARAEWQRRHCQGSKERSQILKGLSQFT